MNLREEINTYKLALATLSNKRKVPTVALTQVDSVLDQMPDLFKKWALEMVGEDLEEALIHQYNPQLQRTLETENATKQEIRQRIEEATE